MAGRCRATASPKLRQSFDQAAVRLTCKTNLNVNGNRCSCFSCGTLRVTIIADDGRAAMRWCVSIGAVLVAGAIAGGGVASLAAPKPATQLTDSTGNAAPVDIELILAV